MVSRAPSVAVISMLTRYFTTVLRIRFFLHSFGFVSSISSFSAVSATIHASSSNIIAARRRKPTRLFAKVPPHRTKGLTARDSLARSREDGLTDLRLIITLL